MDVGGEGGGREEASSTQALALLAPTPSCCSSLDLSGVESSSCLSLSPAVGVLPRDPGSKGGARVLLSPVASAPDPTDT
jgi:hypothetical protein